MNYLAHLFLSCEDEELLLGNFLADLVKNRYQKELSPRVLEGIQLHRKIDTFTDTHPLVLQGTRRLHQRHHKYAPVVIDIFYDYLLVENWQLYTDKNLNDFMLKVYNILSRRKEQIPKVFQAQISNMVQHNWLMSYTSIAGLEGTFERLKRRVSKQEYLENVVQSLEQEHDLLTQEFNQFFPDLIAMVKENCFC